MPSSVLRPIRRPLEYKLRGRSKIGSTPFLPHHEPAPCQSSPSSRLEAGPVWLGGWVWRSYWFGVSTGDSSLRHTWKASLRRCRVTLDYAQSAAHLSAIDPFSLSANYPLSMTLPTAISTFVVPHRTSTNIFDFLGSADVLSKLYQLGFMSALPGVLGLSSMDGVRMLGGVPT